MINLSNDQSKRKLQSGFTLLEMAISIMIVGVVLALAGQAYSLYVENNSRVKTQETITNVTAALSTFKNVNGRYPCPAPIKELRTSVNYGHEIDCSGAPPAAAGAAIAAPSTFLPHNFTSAFYRGGSPIIYTSFVLETDSAYTTALAALTTMGATIDSGSDATMWSRYVSWYPTTSGANCFDYSWNFPPRYHQLICDATPVNTLVATYNAAHVIAGTPGDPARALVAGQCLNGGADPDGLCIEQSTRTDLATPPRIRVGTIPFRDMQLEENDVVDGYGSRLVYAVTEKLANAATFKASEGGIEIQDAAGNVLSGGITSASFVVVSPGKNRNGAVDLQGVVTPCVNGGTNFDGQNCRNFAITTDTQSIYVMDAYATGTDSFDDRIDYFSDTSDELWRRFDPTAETIVDLSEKRVGVGIPNSTSLTDPLVIAQSTVNNVSDPLQHRLLAPTNSMDPTESFQGGALRVGTFTAGNHSGKVLTDNICTETGAKCFSPIRIAGTYDGDPTAGTRGMGCPAGQYMTGIQEGRAVCSPIRIACPIGQAATGTDASGNLICNTPVASCTDQVVNLCGTPYTLLAIGHAGTRTINYTVGGACATATYACTAGAWVLSSRYGEEALSGFACTYASASAPTSSTGGLSCGAGYSGTYAETRKTLCDGTTALMSSSFSADCSCVGKTDNVFCDPSFGGGVVGTKTKVCTGGVLDTAYSVFTGADSLSYPSEAALTAALCSCSKVPNWRIAECGGGKVRVSSPTTPVMVGLPAFPGWPAAEPTKGAYYAQRVDMVSCTYLDEPTNYSNCECSLATQMKETTPTCAVCEKMSAPTQTRQINNGPGCSWIDDPDTSANTVGTCTPKTLTWKSTGVKIGKSVPLSEGHGGSPECGSTCSCATESGTNKTCAKRTATQWKFYKSKCQE